MTAAELDPGADAPLPRASLEARLALVPLPSGSVVVADLHLEASSEPGVEPFVHLCGRLAGAPRLVILGDLFDAWVGPAHLRLAGARRVAAALAELARSGTAVEVVHGNRDFLLGAEFSRASRATIHPYGLLGSTPAGERLLLVHGDELCTRDRSFQRLRAVARSWPVTLAAGLVPLPLALAVARRLRRASTRGQGRELPEEKRMQASAARGLAARHGASTLVCGHAHRARDEQLAGGARWIVLDAFGDAADALTIDAGGRAGLSCSRDIGRRAGPDLAQVPAPG